MDINLKVRSSTGIGFDDIPTEMYLYIFKNLDIQSLRCCLAVSRKWKEFAKSLCELQNLWQALAEDGLVNDGVTHHFKSTLGWKDLYFNSLLWQYVQLANINKSNEIDNLCIKSMHVYRDKLIVVNRNGVEYYDIESLQCIRIFPISNCEDLQETDDILLLVMDSKEFYTSTIFLKAHKDEAIDVEKYLNDLSMQGNNTKQHTFNQSWHWRIVGNSGYVIDLRSVLWKCDKLDNSLSIKSLAKCYGNPPLFTGSVLHSIHPIKGDVFIGVKWGNLLVVCNKSMMFCKVNSEDIPTINIEGAQPPYREGLVKFDAVITVPFGIGFSEGIAPQNILHFRYDDPEMTCGIQHGDVMCRGFDDGRVEITLLRNDSKLVVNLSEFDKDAKHPAVVALEVCELKNMHKLFIATSTKLYIMLLTYPESLLEL